LDVGCLKYKSSVLPAAVPLFCVTASAHDSFFSFFLLSVCLTLFLNSFSDSTSFCSSSLSLSRYSMSLPSSFCLYTPPSSPLFSPLLSWQQCQSGQSDRGKHSTGQSRGRSKGWRIDYVCVCVLRLWVCLRFGHTKLQVT